MEYSMSPESYGPLYTHYQKRALRALKLFLEKKEKRKEKKECLEPRAFKFYSLLEKAEI